MKSTPEAPLRPPYQLRQPRRPTTQLRQAARMTSATVAPAASRTLTGNRSVLRR